MPRRDPIEYIEITKSVASWLLETSLALIKHYLGREFNPRTGIMGEREDFTHNLEDRIPQRDFELRYWFNTVINLLTTITGILSYAIPLEPTLYLNSNEDISEISSSNNNHI